MNEEESATPEASSTAPAENAIKASPSEQETTQLENGTGELMNEAEFMDQFGYQDDEEYREYL